MENETGVGDVTLLEAIQIFFREHASGSLQDLYSALPDAKQHSLRARIYENLGKHFRRIGRGIYVAIEGDAACLVVEGDVWDEVKRLPTESIDALITDPAYGWLDHFVEQGTTRRRMEYDFDKQDMDKTLGFELHRVLKKGAHVFLFVPAETAATRPHIERLIKIMEDCGFVFNKRFIWDKCKFGLGYNGRSRYEGILFMSKGVKRQPCDLAIADVLAVPSIDHRNRRHQTEKPVELLKLLVRFATRAGELILDCFAGSCSAGRAALALGRHSIMIEKSAEILSAALM